MLLREAERFALTDYTVALAAGAALTPAERETTAKRIAELTGLPEGYVLASNLRVPPQRFEKELLRGDPGEPKVIGRFDARLTGAATDAVNDAAEYDPSLSGFYPAYTSAFNEYVRKELKYQSDLPYEVLTNRVQPWNFGGGGTNGYLYVGDNLRDAMTRNPHLKLWVGSGRFDLATPYLTTDYTLTHMTLAPGIRRNITRRYSRVGTCSTTCGPNSSTCTGTLPRSTGKRRNSTRSGTMPHKVRWQPGFVDAKYFAAGNFDDGA